MVCATAVLTVLRIEYTTPFPTLPNTLHYPFKFSDNLIPVIAIWTPEQHRHNPALRIHDKLDSTEGASN
jgi:hypothetical protein